MKKPELAMPAGTLEEALIALRSGADAVYFGMKKFSARKGAVNFSEDDLATIRRYALENGRKIYVAVNTLVDDESLPDLMDVLETISWYGADGVLVQDLGAVSIIKKNFPDLPIHGSTQLAVHTANGVKALQRLGFERAVLSRELSLEEIRAIRKACPDIELKIFIHGALCYGFSGLCMASKIITGRSANEGACAQICRSWFRDRDGNRRYPFSLEDLDSASLIRELADIGIDSLKVEGRLKGPDYAKAVAEYYRAAIDGRDYRALEAQAAAAFRRKSGTGYLLNPERHDMTTGAYTGHRGYPAGKITAIENHTIYADCRVPLLEHDGLMIISDGAPCRFRPDILYRHSGSYALRIDDEDIVSDDGILYKISDSRSTPPKPSLELRKEKRHVNASVTVTKESLSITTGRLTESYQINAEPSENSGEDAIRKTLQQSGDSRHQLILHGIMNSTGFPSFYINPKKLKEIRRTFLSEYDSIPDEKREYSATIADEETSPLPPRKLLSGKDVPWNLEGCMIDGRRWFTLPPVRFSEEKMHRELMGKAEPGDVIGLNNIGDIIFAGEHPEFSYFADIYLYLTNREAAALLKENVPGLIGGYLWLERDSYEKPWPFTPSPVTDFQPPLFISRAWTEEGMYEQNGRWYSVIRKDGITVVSEAE